MFFKSLLFALLPLSVMAQTDTPGKTVATRAVLNIFKSPSDITITPAEYMKLANSGLYTISYINANDTTIVYRLDSTALLRSINKEILLPPLIDMHGKAFNYNKRKTTVINFWSTTCKPCIEEMDSLNAVKERFPNVQFIAITTDPIDKVKQFLDQKQFNYQVVFAQQNEISSLLHVDGYPIHFIVDPKGYLRWIAAGKAPSLAENISKLESIK